jgi:hypothetical protein
LFACGFADAMQRAAAARGGVRCVVDYQVIAWQMRG